MLSTSAGSSGSRSSGSSFASELADVLYLLAHNYSAFTRNERLVWFAEQLLAKDAGITTPRGIFSVLHWIARDGSTPYVPSIDLDFRHATNEVTGTLDTPPSTRPANGAQNAATFDRILVTPKTNVRVFSSSYRLVFMLDVSTSMAIVDPCTGEVLYDQLFNILKNTFRSLIQPISIPGSGTQLRPLLYITVLAQGTLVETFRVLLHGYTLTEGNIETFLCVLKRRLKDLENDIVSCYENPSNRPAVDMASLLQNSTVALKLMPNEACPGLVLVTDGTGTLPENSNAYDNLFMLMNREDICCSAIQVGSGYKPYSNYGYVPDPDSLAHLVTATYGCIIKADDITRGHYDDIRAAGLGPVESDIRCHALQLDLLSRPVAAFGPKRARATLDIHDSTQTTADDYIVWDVDKLRGMMANDYPFPWIGSSPPQPLFSVIGRQYQLSGANLMHLLDCRAREGFQLQAFVVHDDLISTKMTLSWKSNIKVVYNTKCVWRRSLAGCPSPDINVTIDVLAYYDFLQQFASQKATVGSTSLASRFHYFLSQINETDRLLSSLSIQALQAVQPVLLDPSGFATAAAVQRAAELASGRTANSYSSGSSTKSAVERAFWKALSGLTKTAWHRWFRAERIEVVLTPDGPIGSDVLDLRKGEVPPVAPGTQAANEAIKFKYRNSTKEFAKLLEKWSTISHAKNSFARIYTDNNGPNTRLVRVGAASLCIIRLSWEAKNLCVLNLFFFAMPPEDRQEVISDLRAGLAALTTLENHRALRTYQKPLRLALMKFSYTMSDTKILEQVASSQGSGPISPSLEEPSRIGLVLPSFSLLGFYLKHKRWIWKLDSESTRKGVMEALVRTRVREGFTLVHGDGITAMWRELTLRTSGGVATKCLLQYSLTDVRGYVVVDLALEPQDGFLELNGKQEYCVFTVAKKLVFDIDHHIISTIFSFDHLAAALAAKVDIPVSNETKEILLMPSIGKASYLEPGFDLKALIDLGVRHTESYMSFDSSEGRGKNMLLHQVLRHILSRLADGPVPNVGTHPVFDGAPCFGKSIGLSELVLAFVHGLDDPVSLLMPSPSTSPLVHHSSSTSPLRVTMYQCPRAAEPPRDASIMLRALLQSRAPHVTEDRFAPIGHQTFSFCEHIQQEYKRGFVKALYTHLRDNFSVSQSDFEYALEACKEYLMEVDISQLTKMLRRSPDGKAKTDPDDHFDADVQFTNTFCKLFQRVPGSPTYFYYSPQETTETDFDDAETMDRDDDPPEVQIRDPDDEVEDAEGDDGWQADPGRAPLKSATAPANQMAVFEFPFFLRLECGLFTNDHEGTRGFRMNQEASLTFPIPSMPTTKTVPAITTVNYSRAVVRLIGVVLPRETLPTSSGTSPSNSLNDNYSPGMPSGSVLDQTGSSDSIQPFSKLPKSIRLILQDGKKRIKSVMAQQILNMLRDRLPLTKPILDIVNYYMAHLSPPQLIRISLPLTWTDTREGRSNGSNLFMQELERSKSLTVERVDRTFVSIVRPKGGQLRKSLPYCLPYWLLIGVSGDKVRVRLHCHLDKVSRSKLYAHIRTSIKAINDRVNQLCLLSSLYETRVCSVLLVPTEDPSAAAQESDDVDRSDSSSTAPEKRFWDTALQYLPGHYACPRVHSFTIKVYPRLDLKEAESHLFNSALNHFAVSNRQNLYVVREQNGSIYYLRLSFQRPEASSAADHPALATAPPAAQIHVRVYGVSQPSKEITVDLQASLEGKLTDKALQTLSNLLLRNPLLKLTHADMDYLKPADSKHRRFTFEIPSCIPDPRLWHAFFRQNLLRQQLATINVPDEDAQTNTDETGSTFLYNNWISLPGLPARLNFGQGLAMVSIIPHYGQASLTQVRSVEFNDVQTREIVDGVEQGPPVSPSSMSLDLHLWIRGQIKEEALLEHITTIANQTVAEFLLETDLGVSADSLAVPTIGPFVADCAKVFARAAGFASSAVKVINTTTQVPAWAIHNILLEIEESVRDSSQQLYPNLYAHRRQGAWEVGQSVPLSEIRQSDAYQPYVVTKRRLQNLADPDGLLLMKDRMRFALVASKRHDVVSQLASDPTSSDAQPNIPANTPFSFAQQDNGETPSTSPNVAANQTPLQAQQRSGSTSATRDRVGYRRCFGLVLLTASQIQVMLYNWNSAAADALEDAVRRLVDWTTVRLHLMENVLHQKMGLFNHTPSLPRQKYEYLFTPATATHSGSSTSGATTGGSSVGSSGTVPSASSSAQLPSGTALQQVITAPGGRMGFNRFKAAPPQPTIKQLPTAPTTEKANAPPLLPRGASFVKESSSGNLATLPASSGTRTGGPGMVRDSSSRSIDRGSPAPGKEGRSASSSDKPASATTTVEENNDGTHDKHIKFRFDSIYELLANSMAPPRARIHHSKGKRTTAPLLIPLDGLLRRAYPLMTPSRKHDPVQRHALQMKQVALRSQRKQLFSKALGGVFQQWARTHTSGPESAIDINNLKMVLKACRLMHSSRTPFYLSDLYKRELVIPTMPPSRPPRRATPLSSNVTSSTSDYPKKFSVEAHVGPEQLLKLDAPPPPSQVPRAHLEVKKKWRSAMLVKFFEEYSKYLVTFGLRKVDIRYPREKEANIPRSNARSTPDSDQPRHAYQYDALPEGQVLYFQKVFRGGLLIVTLGNREEYVFCNVYTMFNFSQNYSVASLTPSADRYTARMAKELAQETKDGAKRLRNHTEESSRVKDSLHLNSFVYDFHVRQLTSFLEAGSINEYPATEFVNMLQAMTLYYDTPKHARNSIRTSSDAIDLGRSQLSPLEVWSFLSLHSSRYNMYSMSERGISPAVFVVSSTQEMINKPRNKQNQLLDSMEDDSYYFVAFINDGQSPIRSDTCNLASSFKQLYARQAPGRTSSPTQDNDSRSSSLPGGRSNSSSMRNLATMSAELRNTGSGTLTSSGKHTSIRNYAAISTIPESERGKLSKAIDRYINITYFVLRANRITPFPFTNILSRVSAKTTSHLNVSALQPEMEEAISNCHTQLQRVTKEAFMHSDRDLLWTKLVQEGAASLSADQIQTLLQRVNTRLVEDLDPALKEMVTLAIDWVQLFSHLFTLYGQRARQFSINNMLHLFIFNANDLDSALYLTMEDGTGAIELQICRRDSKFTSGKHAAADAAHVTAVVNAICHFLWKSMILRDRRPKQ